MKTTFTVTTFEGGAAEFLGEFSSVAAARAAAREYMGRKRLPPKTYGDGGEEVYWNPCVGDPSFSDSGVTITLAPEDLARGWGKRRDQQDETVWDEGVIISPEPPRGPDCRE